MGNAPFRSWLLANFETVANILIFATAIIIAVIQAPDATASEEAKNDYWAIALVFGGALFGICAVLCATSGISFFSDLMRLLGSIVAVALIIVGLYSDYSGDVNSELDLSPYYKPALISSIVAAVVGGIIAIASACFVYSNFGDVASRRMLYRNSKVDLFDIQWKYTFNRFVVIFCYFITITPTMTIFRMN